MRVLFILLCAYTTAASAESPLSLDEAVQLALREQPALLALERAATAATETSGAEARLPDPKLRFGVQNLPITGAEAFSLDAEDMTMTTVGVMQEFVRGAKLDTRAARAGAEAEQWSAEREQTARQIARDSALAWLDIYYARELNVLVDELLRDAEVERATAQAQFTAGRMEAREVLALDAMRGMMEHRQTEARRTEGKGRAMLARWIGQDAKRPLTHDLPALSPPALAALEARLSAHPMLAVARHSVTVAEHEARLARLATKPDWNMELMYGARSGGRDDMITLLFGMDLPIAAAQRQLPRLAAGQALAERAQWQVADRERQLRSELLTAWSDWQSVTERERRHADLLLPAARARADSALAAYRGGKAPLSAVWEARRALAEVSQEHLSLHVDAARAAAQLRYFE
jgi:outer membrane protein TolC